MVKFFKKVIVSMMTVGVILALAACSKSGSDSAQSEPVTVAEETGGRDDKVPDPNAPVLTVVSVYQG